MPSSLRAHEWFRQVSIAIGGAFSRCLGRDSLIFLRGGGHPRWREVTGIASLAAYMTLFLFDDSIYAVHTSASGADQNNEPVGGDLSA